MENFESFFKRLTKVCSERNLWMHPLGKTGRHYIWAVGNSSDHGHLLVVGGCHGDEVGGPLAILKWLETVREHDLHGVGLAIIPVLSPIAYGKRHNSYTRVNSGFIYKTKERKSLEAVAILPKIDMLSYWARDGFLSLHETADSNSFLIFHYGNNNKQAGLMVEKGSEYFPITHDCRLVESGYKLPPLINGLCKNAKDGTIEDRLWRDGSPFGIVTETPGKYSLKKRIEANVALIKKFIEVRRGF